MVLNETGMTAKRCCRKAENNLKTTFSRIFSLESRGSPGIDRHEEQKDAVLNVVRRRTSGYARVASSSSLSCTTVSLLQLSSG